MENVYIIADDTTGANSSAILLKKLSYDCYSIHSEFEDLKSNSVYAFSTDSRAISKEDAYKRVSDVLNKIDDKNSIYNKRIDSTLRGNLGSEIDAFLDFFPNKKAIVVACFPDSGRTCLNNTLYVNGELLENTDVAKDPKCPVNTSIVNNILKKQTNKKVSSIEDLNVIRGLGFKELLLDKYNSSDIIVIDAQTNNDIDLISKTIVDLGLDIITVDPGPFTYHYSKHMNKPNIKFHGLIGSVTPLSLMQLEYIKEIGGAVYELNVEKVLSSDYEEYLNECLNDLLRINNDLVLITTLSFDYDSKIDLYNLSVKENTDIEVLSNKINERISRLFVTFNQKVTPHCVYTSGGDTTVEFLNQVNSYGVKLEKEILPLTVASKILGGEFDGLHIVSKGGLIGSKDTIEFIYKFMKEGIDYE